MLQRLICRPKGASVLIVLMVGFLWLFAGDIKSSAGATNPEIEKIVERAYLMKYPVEKLDPMIVRALSRFKMQLSPEEEELAYNAYKKQIYQIGPGKLVLGIADGFGDNVWRQLVLMEIILQAMTYPEIGKIVYTNAHGKLEEAVANMRSLVAQGVDMIVAYLDHGDAMLPSMREALANGIPVVPYIAEPPAGKPGKDFTAIVAADRTILGKRSAEKAVQLLGQKGTAVLLGGTPGNPSTFFEHKGSMEIFSKYPGWEVMKADTNWTQQGVFEAMSGLLATGKKIDVVIYDYANAARAIFRAYQQAGNELPIIIADGADNGFFKDCEQFRAKNPKFRAFSCHSNTWYSRVCVTASFESKQGKSIPTVVRVPVPLFEVKPGMYDPEMPDDYGFPLIPKNVVRKMFPK